uniref:IS66 family transposase n=1 Tax=Solidesulfovibrio carbinolicus TaxID=296842 RepID=UPI001F3DCCB8|nr:IS66 family transposase [Solidesulfovibrio carbinolicus]
MLFRYHPSRAGNVAAEILGDFKGYLTQTDGYSGYEALGEREGLRHLGCMAHVRRKFVEVEKTAGKKGKGGTAHATLDLIGKLYDVERQAEKQQLNPEQIKVLRAEKSRPILDKLKALLDARAATTPPKSLLGKAIGYAIKQWERLVVYLEDGRLRPDNNIGSGAVAMSA